MEKMETNTSIYKTISSTPWETSATAPQEVISVKDKDQKRTLLLRDEEVGISLEKPIILSEVVAHLKKSEAEYMQNGGALKIEMSFDNILEIFSGLKFAERSESDFFSSFWPWQICLCHRPPF